MALDDELESGIPLGQDQAVESGQIQPPTLPPGIPYNPEGVVSSPYAAPVQAPPRVVIGSGPTPGLLPPNQRPLAGASPARIAQEQFRESNPNLPIDQAEAAYAAALRFQGQRQYQEDLQRGLPQSEAFARNAVNMFANPKNTAAQAASLLKAITPEQDKLMDVGGVLYRVPRSGGQPQALTQPKVTIPKLDEVDKEMLKQDTARLKEIENDARFNAQTVAGEALRRQAHDMRNAITVKYRQRVAPQPSTTTTATQPAPSAPTESPKVTTKAQYDALQSGTVYVGKDGKRYRKP